MLQRVAPEAFGHRGPKEAHGHQQQPRGRRTDLIRQHAHGHVAHEQHGQHKGEHAFEYSAKRFIRHPRDIEQIVITPHDALRPHGPKTERRKDEHQRVVDHDADDAQRGEPAELSGGGLQVQLQRGIRHHAQRKQGVEERAQIHHAQRDEKAGVHRQQQKEIHLPGADEFGQVGAIGQEEGLIDLLDEIAAADEQNHLPFAPGADAVGLREQHGDEAELQAEPQDLHDDPEDEVPFEGHLARHGIFPEREVEREIMFQGRHQRGKTTRLKLAWQLSRRTTAADYSSPR